MSLLTTPEEEVRSEVLAEIERLRNGGDLDLYLEPLPSALGDSRSDLWIRMECGCACACGCNCGNPGASVTCSGSSIGGCFSCP